jgi:hypothetical protein
MFASAPHGFDGSPDLARLCIDTLGVFFDRVFRPEGTAYAITPGVPGNAFIGMDGAVLDSAPPLLPMIDAMISRPKL